MNILLTDLLRIEPNAPCEPVHHDMPSEWYYQQGIEPGESFNGRGMLNVYMTQFIF